MFQWYFKVFHECFNGNLWLFLKEYEPSHDGDFDIFIEYSNEALEDINEVIKHGLDNDSLILPMDGGGMSA